MSRGYSASYWQRKIVAPSAYLIFLGLNTKIKGLRHHNLILDPHWQSHFDDIFVHPRWPKAPSYYVCAPSKTDPAVAPKGCENLFILVPIAAGLKDTKSRRDLFFDQVILHLEQTLGQAIRPHILVKRLFAHQDFSDRYHAYQGTALGLAHTLRQTAFFRPKTKSPKIDNLYFCGAYPHPGIGTAPSIISGQIAADTIIRNLV